MGWLFALADRLGKRRAAMRSKAMILAGAAIAILAATVGGPVYGSSHHRAGASFLMARVDGGRTSANG